VGRLKERWHLKIESTGGGDIEVDRRGREKKSY
jgi:hypothetical protein